MSPEQTELAIKYLTERLPPEDQQELNTLLGVSDEKSSDLAEEAMAGRIAMDKLPPRIMRQVIARNRPGATAEKPKTYAEMFPNAERLR